MSRKPTPPDAIGLLLRLLHQHWAAAIDAALRDAGFDGIRPPHANVFPFVPAEGIQVSQLTRLARVRKQTMAQAIEELEAMGYVERRPDPSDRRARLVFLTERGRAVRPVAAATARKVEAEWSKIIGRGELETLRGTLGALLARLGDDLDGDPPAS